MRAFPRARSRHPGSIRRRIFLPGYLARSRSYEPGLPDDWIALQAPLEIRATGSLERHRDWLVEHIADLGQPVVLGGHSMGASVAVMVAARAPERVAGLVLVAPAGLPISKPIRRITQDFLRHLAAGHFRPVDVLLPALDLVRAPQAAVRAGRTVRRLDLSEELRAVREAGVRTTVIACATDTLTTPTSARRVAELTGGSYRELRLEGGHVWMFGCWDRFAQELAQAACPAT